jgi:transposase InsO family protein
MVARNIDANGVVACLERIAAQRGAPMFLRFDNGPEFIANAVADWCRFNGTGTVFIDPGSPWQNAWIESFNGRLRDECPCAPFSRLLVRSGHEASRRDRTDPGLLRCCCLRSRFLHAQCCRFRS